MTFALRNVTTDVQESPLDPRVRIRPDEVTAVAQSAAMADTRVVAALASGRFAVVHVAPEIVAVETVDAIVESANDAGSRGRRPRRG